MKATTKPKRKYTRRATTEIPVKNLPDRPARKQRAAKSIATHDPRIDIALALLTTATELLAQMRRAKL